MLLIELESPAPKYVTVEFVLSRHMQAPLSKAVYIVMPYEIFEKAMEWLEYFLDWKLPCPCGDLSHPHSYSTILHWWMYGATDEEKAQCYYEILSNYKIGKQ